MAPTDIETDRLSEALSPLVLQQLSDAMDRLEAQMGDDPPRRKFDKKLHGLYMMGIDHFKGRLLSRLRTILLERKFREAAEALQPTPPHHG